MALQPLAERMRPKTLDEYVGQKHLVGPKGLLKPALDAGIIPSLILWGPPGVGKTTLARLLAARIDAPFHALSAIDSGVKEVRETLKTAENQTLFKNKRPVLFIDEIHRFSKSQQDALLGAVERGVVTLIGATTENPGFEVISALLSRAQVYVLQPLSRDELMEIAHTALSRDVDLSPKKITLEEDDALLKFSGGDARKLLNVLELVCSGLSAEGKITNAAVENVLQHQALRYDKDGDQHYDIISAFIKSIRGSDPNAGLYWLARMLDGGEDPKFIARRLLILAAEDIGNANPTALILANTTFDAVTKIGMPESRIILAQCVTYLAASPKSNAAYKGINQAQALVKETGNLPVPVALRNAANSLMKTMDYGKGYKYSHDFPGHFAHQEFLPDEISGTTLYNPADNDRENQLRRALKSRWGDKYGY